MSSFLQFCQWLGNTSFSATIRESTWYYPIIESVHVLGLTLFVGLLLLWDLRLIGITLRRVSVSEVWARLIPWISLGAVILTGVPLLASLAFSKYYTNEAFWLKMYFFLAALLFTFTIRQRVAFGDPVRANSVIGKAVGLVSVLLWSGVGIMGRGIGFY